MKALARYDSSVKNILSMPIVFITVGYRRFVDDVFGLAKCMQWITTVKQNMGNMGLTIDFKSFR